MTVQNYLLAQLVVRRGLISSPVPGYFARLLPSLDFQNFNSHPSLAHNDYKGVFWPKSRARTIAEKEANLVDRCTTFYKNSKYILLDKHLTDFANTAINRPDMKDEHDVFNGIGRTDRA
ncbi:uncharacterized protein BDZ99DRAFT_514080 [Mytilinidion resinicola]|uniref:Uncharacterized protein n=1 Tax=Mytilinidion resinicola TaxID=574789 RepID=A0A6A6ZC23_9PEZI|nr:uncharacterized protein BDZ99DRAFT_514080 [Mytilinidion resinicola]KAF2817864.1 hypothetical protein BDZ99DRAFT_514080 [Mytilinidion resinicola]